MDQLQKILQSRILLLISTLNLDHALLLTKSQVDGLLKQIEQYNIENSTGFLVEKITFTQVEIKEGYKDVDAWNINKDSLIEKELNHNEAILLIEEYSRSGTLAA